jgi:hypothetical protein
MEMNRRESNESNHDSSVSAPRTHTAIPGPWFEKAFTRTEVLGALESGLRELAGVVEMAVLVPLGSRWVPVWCTGASTSDLAVQAMRARPGGLRDSVATLSLAMGDRVIARVVILGLDSPRTNAFDAPGLADFLYDAAFALRRSRECPTVRPPHGR